MRSLEAESVTRCRSFRCWILVGVLWISACSSTAPRTWSNCSQSQGCETATLDIMSGSVRDILDAYGQSLETSVTGEGMREARRLFLTPGPYTLLFDFEMLDWAISREDRFQVEAGHHYQATVRGCAGLWTIASPWCQEVPSEAFTLWIEDIVSSRVVAGAKWCRKDADCPQSTCARDDGHSVGVCTIAGIECKSGPIFGLWGRYGEAGRCGPAAPGGGTNDWPGFANFKPATPPDSTHGLVYIYIPEMEDVTSRIRIDPDGSPGRTVRVSRGTYEPLYAPAGRLSLSADDEGSHRPAPTSVTLDVVAGETYYVRMLNRQNVFTGVLTRRHAALEVVDGDEALGQLRRCRLIPAEDAPADSTTTGP